MHKRIFDELYYGKIKTVDLHGLTKEEARSEILHELGFIDLATYNGIEFVHGYRSGQTLKKLLRNEIEDDRIEEKINLNASSTLYILKK